MPGVVTGPRRVKAGLLRLQQFMSAFGLRGACVFLKLHVGRTGKLVQVPVPGVGKAWIRKGTSDAMVYRQLFVEREADPRLFPQGKALHEKYREIVGRGRTPLVIDCGANNGLSSLFLASLYPQAIVVAIEPSDANFGLLTANVKPHHTIRPLRAGVSDVADYYLRISNPETNPCGFRTEECYESDPGAVPARTVPSILEEFPDCEPLIVKIDIEGWEKNLLRSNAEWLEKIPLLMIELHDWMFPGEGRSSAFLARVGDIRCDFVVNGENILVFNWSVLPAPA